MVTAGYYALKYIQEYQAIEKAAAYGDKLTAALNDLFDTRKDLPWFAYNLRSIVHVETSCYNGLSLVENMSERLPEALERYTVLQIYAMVMLTQGVQSLGDRFYCCMAHDDESLDKALKAWEYLLAMIPAA